MVLGKLPVPGRPTNLDYSKARAYCSCSWCGWGLFGHFFSRLSFSLLSPSLWETARYRLKYCLKRPLNPNQPTNQPTNYYICCNILEVFKADDTGWRLDENVLVEPADRPEAQPLKRLLLYVLPAKPSKEKGVFAVGHRNSRK